MKYQLETIPVHDAWASDAPCPLCALMAAAEERHVKYFLGNSVMNPESRLLVNEKGFCKRHFPMLREARRAHHLGLVTHTHLGRTREKLAGTLKSLASGSPKAAMSFATQIRRQTETCLVCESQRRDLLRYSYTAVVLYGKENEFRDLFHASKGPCLPHAADLTDMAVEVLGKKERQVFLVGLSSHLEETLEKLEADVLHFTKKFDAQNDALPWGDSKDAHARVVQMLSGEVVRLED